MAVSTGRAVLVTSIGLGRYEEVTWKLGDDPAAVALTPYPSVALARLCPELAGATALVLATREAKSESLPSFATALEAAGLSVEAVDIPAGTDEGQIYEIFEQILSSVPEKARVSFDITFALRHLPLLAFCSLRYLVALKDVTLDKAELKRQLGLARWYVEQGNEDQALLILRSSTTDPEVSTASSRGCAHATGSPGFAHVRERTPRNLWC